MCAWGLARAREAAGASQASPRIPVPPSRCGQVKTTRALRDWTKPEFPHVRDKPTVLRYVGDKSLERLRSMMRAGGPLAAAPVAALATVGDLRALLAWAAQDDALEGKVRAELGKKVQRS